MKFEKAAGGNQSRASYRKELLTEPIKVEMKCWAGWNAIVIGALNNHMNRHQELPLFSALLSPTVGELNKEVPGALLTQLQYEWWWWSLFMRFSRVGHMVKDIIALVTFWGEIVKDPGIKHEVAVTLMITLEDLIINTFLLWYKRWSVVTQRTSQKWLFLKCLIRLLLIVTSWGHEFQLSVEIGGGL